MPSKVPFQVVYSSSADDNHREKELEVLYDGYSNVTE